MKGGIIVIINQLVILQQFSFSKAKKCNTETNLWTTIYMSILHSIIEEYPVIASWILWPMPPCGPMAIDNTWQI